jgi:hypothetical protein
LTSTQVESEPNIKNTIWDEIRMKMVAHMSDGRRALTTWHEMQCIAMQCNCIAIDVMFPGNPTVSSKKSNDRNHAHDFHVKYLYLYCDQQKETGEKRLQLIRDAPNGVFLTFRFLPSMYGETAVDAFPKTASMVTI